MNLKALFLVLFISAITQAQNATNSSEIKVSDPDFFSKSSFGAMFYTLGGMDDAQLKRSNPSYSIYDSYVSFSWKLPNDIRVAVMPTFGYTTAGNDYRGNEVTDKFYWRDSSVSISQNHILEDYIPASVELKQKARLYLPTSDASKDEGLIARLRLEVEGRYYFDRYSNIRYYIKPSYYFQRTTAFLSNTNKIYGTKKSDVQHGPELNLNINKYFSFKPGFEIEDNWSNESTVNFRDERHQTSISNRIGFEVRPNRDMNFTLGLQESRDLIDPSKTPIVSYSLLTNVTLF